MRNLKKLSMMLLIITSSAFAEQKQSLVLPEFELSERLRSVESVEVLSVFCSETRAVPRGTGTFGYLNAEITIGGYDQNAVIEVANSEEREVLGRYDSFSLVELTREADRQRHFLIVAEKSADGNLISRVLWCLER